MKNLIKKNIITNKPSLKAVKYGLFVLLMISTQLSFAYNIRLEIENCPDYYIYLGKHKGPDFEVIDSVLSDNGIVEFKNDSELETGVYFIVIPPQTRFDFLIANQQNIVIKTDTHDILGKLEISGEKQYQVFVEIQKDIAKINKQRTQLEMEIEFFKMYQKDTVESIQTRIDSLNQIQVNIYSTYKKDIDDDTFLHKIISILEPFAVSDSVAKLQYTSPSDHYQYYIDHYLDRVDFKDESLINTPEFIFHKTISDYCYYFFDLRISNPELVYPSIDKLIQRTEGNESFNQYVLSYLISRYENPNDLRLESYLVYVYRAYFMADKPEWVSQQAFDIMQYRIERIQYNVIGLVGKNLDLVDENNKKISTHDVNSNYKVLIFWEPDCELCTDAIIELKEEYIELEANNIQVVAVCTNNEAHDKWASFIDKNELRWINVIDKDNSSNLEIYYGTFKTPRLYILDKGNKILTKDIKPEHTFDFIQSYTERTKTGTGTFN